MIARLLARSLKYFPLISNILFHLANCSRHTHAPPHAHNHTISNNTHTPTPTTQRRNDKAKAKNIPRDHKGLKSGKIEQN